MAPTKPCTPKIDSLNSLNSLNRVFLGGSWYESTANIVRAAFRYFLDPTYRYYDVGFRCVLRSRAPRA